MLRNFVFNGIPRDDTEFRNLIPAEFLKSVKFRRNSVVRNSVGHSTTISHTISLKMATQFNVVSEDLRPIICIPKTFRIFNTAVDVVGLLMVLNSHRPWFTHYSKYLQGFPYQWSNEFVLSIFRDQTKRLILNLCHCEEPVSLG